MNAEGVPFMMLFFSGIYEEHWPQWAKLSPDMVEHLVCKSVKTSNDKITRGDSTILYS